MTECEVVKASSLGRWYGQVVGLSDLNVRIGKGITGLLGPNGAGKSTFLQLIVGSLRPSRGELRVLGARPFANRDLFCRLGFVPQQDALFDDLSGLGMVTVLMRLAGFRAREARVRAARALDRVGLGSVGKRRIGGYSKGMRQRVKIAQAIAHDPVLVVLDEPLTGLDPVGRREIIALLRGLSREGVDIIASSHVLHEVEAMTEQIVLLHRGRLLARGSIGDVRQLLSQHPSHLEIQAKRPRDLARELLALPGVLSVEVQDEDPAHASTQARDNGRLRLQTTSAQDLLRALTEIGGSGSYGIGRIETRDENLEAVFDYLVAD